MRHTDYTFRSARLLKAFDRSLARVKRTLVSRLGGEGAARLTREARLEYEALIPRIPYIGDRSPFLVFLLPATRYLAVYRALQRQGRSIGEAGPLVLEIGEAELRAIPAPLRGLIGYLWFTPWFRERLRRRAMESRERPYPSGYALTYVHGDGHAFHYGVDYTECASVKLLAAENALELAPYVCAVDSTASEMLGWGLQRTMTLAQGAGKCDFRFKKGAKTNVAVARDNDAAK